MNTEQNHGRIRVLSPEGAVKRILLAHLTRDAAITYRMPFGVPGDISRPSTATVEAQAFGATAFSAYGIPAKIVNGVAIPIAAQNDIVYGMLARPFPITGANASDPLGTSVPPTSGVANLMRRGYMTVKVQLGAASCALGSAVYIRYQNPVAGQIVGGIEGASTGNTYQLSGTYSLGTGAYFTGPADANGNAEIAFNL